jgi:hypothetical protein
MNGEDNPFDDISLTLRLDNPNGTSPEARTQSFDAASALSQFVMIEDMPDVVNIEMTHKGDNSNSEIQNSIGSVTLWTGSERTANSDVIDASWDYFWDNTGDILDNFKLKCDINAHLSGENAKIGFNIAGTVLEDSEKKELIYNFSDISMNFVGFDEDEMSFAMTFKLNLRSAAGADIGYDRTTSVPVTDLTPMQLLRIAGSFSEDPIIGGLIGWR